MTAPDATAHLTVTLRPHTVQDRAGYEYETTDPAGAVVSEGWCAGTTEHVERWAKDHAFRNLVRRAQKGLRR